MRTTHRERQSVTISAGYGSVNTFEFKGGLLMQVIAEPPTSTNIYDLYIVDQNNSKVYNSLACEGSFEQHAIFIPLRGVYTVTVSSATVDEIVPTTFVVDE